MSQSNVVISQPFMDQSAFRVSIQAANGVTDGFTGNSNTIEQDTNTFLLAAMDNQPIKIGHDGDILTQDTVERIAEELIVAQVDEMMSLL